MPPNGEDCADGNEKMGDAIEQDPNTQTFEHPEVQHPSTLVAHWYPDRDRKPPDCFSPEDFRWVKSPKERGKNWCIHAIWLLLLLFTCTAVYVHIGILHTLLHTPVATGKARLFICDPICHSFFPVLA